MRLSAGHRVLCAAAWAILLVAISASAGEARVSKMARSPYVGAIVVDAETGEVLFEDAADRKTYPASVVKMMDLLLVLEAVERGEIALDDAVRVTAEAAKTGGSQVYLKENEVLVVEDLLYALMIQSANDAAVALAIHVGGSRDAFVGRMNARATQLGMTSTRFTSPHGLPPSAGQDPDLTTARDISKLARALLGRPGAIRYTSTKTYAIRSGQFVMRSHNSLLESFPGCDGLKTGYFSAAGFSIAATASRGGKRMIAVVLGSESSKLRDQKTRDLLNLGFTLATERTRYGETAVVPVFRQTELTN
jgi:D-alanyl-D-alanine carboxypeptidase (penicillin-binding protein 5/6)